MSSISYRTPAESVFNRLTSDEQTKITKFVTQRLSDQEELDGQLFSYAVDDHARERLTRSGITLSMLCYQAHSHPICKILENYMLYKVLPGYLDNKFFFVGIKKHKLNFFKSRNKNLSLISSINRLVTSKDLDRYSSDFVIYPSKVEFHNFKSVLNSKTSSITSLIPNVISKQSRKLFLHDELHYWSVDELCIFLEVTKPEQVLATVVIPAELLLGSKESLNPWCYTYEVDGNKIFFMPDGVATEGYNQPVASAIYLKARSIRTPSGVNYTIDILHSKFAHHLISIKRTDLITDDVRYFSGFDAISLSELGGISSHLQETYPVSAEFVKKVYRYLRTLKKPDEQSAMAKLSQIVPDPTGREITFFEDFSRLVIATEHVNSIFLRSHLKYFESFLLSVFPKVASLISKSYRSCKLENFVSTLKPLIFKVKTVQLTESFEVCLNLLEFDDFFKESKDPEDLMDRAWGCSEDAPNGERLSAPYDGIWTDEMGFSLFTSSQNSWFLIIEKWIVENFSNEFCFSLTKRELTLCIDEVLGRTILGRNFKLMDGVQNIGRTLANLKRNFKSKLNSFYKFGWLWFLSGENKAYTKFLTDNQTGSKVEVEFGKIWKKVVSDAVSSIDTVINWRVAKEYRGYCRLECYRGEANEEKKPSPTVEVEQPIFAREPVNIDEFMPPEEQKGNKSELEVFCPCGASIIKSDFIQKPGWLENLNFPDKLRGRSAALFSRDGTGYKYTGAEHTSRGWPLFLDEILNCNGFEVGLFNQCLAQEFEDGARIPMHADDEDIYDIDHQVLTVCLRGSATIGICCGKGVNNFNLDESQSYLMPFGFQRRHKHEVINCKGKRISLTFRLTKPEEILLSQSSKESSVSISDDFKEMAESAFNKNGSNILKLDLCDCYQSSSFGKFDQLKGKIRKLLRLEGHAELDFAYMFRAKNQRVADMGIKEDGLAITLMGTAEIVEVPDSKPILVKQVEKVELVGFERCWLSDSSLVIFATKPLRNPGNQIRLHKNDCQYGGFNEVLFGCEINLLNEFEPEKFHKFRVPGDGNCFWHCIATILGVDGLILKEICNVEYRKRRMTCSKLKRQLEVGVWAEREAVAFACIVHDIQLKVLTAREEVTWVFNHDECKNKGTLHNESWHFEPCVPTNGCVVRAIAELMGRSEVDVLSALCKSDANHIYDELMLGNGLSIFDLENVFRAFDVAAVIDNGRETLELNPEGKMRGFFTLDGDHLELMKKVNKKEFSPHAVGHATVNKTSVDILGQAGTTVRYFPCIDRAGRLADSLYNGTTGVLCSNLYNGKENFRKFLKEPFERNICCIMGTFGSGKSTLFKNFVRANAGRATTFISPRRALADQTAAELKAGFKGGKGKDGKALWNVRTFETFILDFLNVKIGHVLIIDEIQLYPPGYLDLVLMLVEKNVSVFLAGDPCQSNYDSEKDRKIFEGVHSDIIHVLNGCNYKYNMQSRRFTNSNFMNRLPCTFNEGSFTGPNEEYQVWTTLKEFVAFNDNSYEVVLVSGFDEKKIVKAHLGQNTKVLTFGESTGLTFRSGVIMVHADSIKTDERRWITALTRFRQQIQIVNITGMMLENVIARFQGRALWRFFNGKASPQDLESMLPGKPEMVEGFTSRVGRDEGRREERLAGDPWLKTEIFLGQQEDVEIAQIEEAVAQEEWFKTHLPIFDMEPIRANWVHRIMLREFREVRMGTEVSEQFSDEHSKSNGKILTNAAERFETIYPRHRGNDSVTFMMAIKKRLTFSNPSVAHGKFLNAKCEGKEMLDEFLKRVPIRPERDPDMMARAVNEFEEKKLSKSAATIENHSGRSCKDWLLDVAFIFMKSQHCTKFDNRFRDAKAGQTLACFQHSILCRFAPTMRYIEMKLMQALPSNLYIHSGKGIDSLEKWVKEMDFSGECTESDYEAFDASQDHIVLVFEVEIMEYLGIDRSVIEDYIFIKTHLKSKLGSFAIMRFTGEASTFLFNTMANMLFTFLRYELNGSEAICFAGDDMCANRRLRVRKDRDRLLKMMTLKAKVTFTCNPTFCGWCLMKYGVYKRPQLVLERMQIARETNNLSNCLDNYAIEVSYAYLKGELLSEVMSEEEMNNHYQCVRIIVKNKGLLRSNIKALFDSKCVQSEL